MLHYHKWEVKFEILIPILMENFLYIWTVLISLKDHNRGNQIYPLTYHLIINPVSEYWVFGAIQNLDTKCI